jgi:hypothetical protein
MSGRTSRVGSSARFLPQRHLVASCQCQQTAVTIGDCPEENAAARAGCSEEAVTKMVEAYTHAGYQRRLDELDATS